MASWNGIVLTVAFVAIYGIHGNILLPKIFVDVNPIENGFKIRLQKEFVDTYLDPRRMPTVFLEAISLNHKHRGQRLMYHRGDTVQLADRLLRIGDLESKAWYLICVEFENVIREHNRGNTSTSCKMMRTLDSTGIPRYVGGAPVVDRLTLYKIGSDEMRFAVPVDADFPLEITAYLEAGSIPAQRFFLSQPSTLDVIFGGLPVDRNYGRLCLIYRPLIQTYTMMGRNPYVTQKECHFRSLETDTGDEAIMK